MNMIEIKNIIDEQLSNFVIKSKIFLFLELNLNYFCFYCKLRDFYFCYRFQ